MEEEGEIERRTARRSGRATPYVGAKYGRAPWPMRGRFRKRFRTIPCQGRLSRSRNKKDMKGMKDTTKSKTGIRQPIGRMKPIRTDHPGPHGNQRSSLLER
jgi:hypothetical protein